MIVCRQEVITDTNRIITVFRKRMDYRTQHVLHRLRLLLLYKYDRQLQNISHHNSRSNTAGFDRYNLINMFAFKTIDELFGNLVQKHRVHLMVNKTIDFQDTSRITSAVLQNTLFK